MPVRARTMRSTVFPAAPAAPWLLARKIQAPSAAAPAAAPPAIRARISHANSNRPTSTPPAFPSRAISPPRTPPISLTATMLPFASPVLARFSLASLLLPEACSSLRSLCALSVPALSFFFFPRRFRKRKTRLRQSGAPSRTLHKFQKCSRRNLILRVLQNNRSLFKRRMHFRWNLPALPIAHRGGNRQGHRHNPSLSISCLHKLRR